MNNAILFLLYWFWAQLWQKSFQRSNRSTG
jgi:hypothetical protein